MVINLAALSSFFRAKYLPFRLLPFKIQVHLYSLTNVKKSFVYENFANNNFTDREMFRM
jgi:hypothetical protein